MSQYKVTIRNNVTQEEFERYTGLDLSNTDMSNKKCVKVRELVVKSDRANIFSAALRLIGPLGGNLSIKPI